MGDSVTREILLEHFGVDDQRHTELRDEFRKAGEDKKTVTLLDGIKSKLGKTLLSLHGSSPWSFDPSGEEPSYHRRMYIVVSYSRE